MATSPLYVPPEEGRGEAITARGDIYSLGVFAFELLTGRSPVPGDGTFVDQGDALGDAGGAWMT